MQLSREAYHEAGHAVVGVVTGYRVREARIDGKGAGVCRFDDSVSPIILLAGGAAERIAWGSVPDQAVRLDHDRAKAILEAMGEAHSYSAVEEAARTVLLQAWGAVVAVANPLQRAGYLEEGETMQIIQARLPRDLACYGSAEAFRKGLSRLSDLLSTASASRSPAINQSQSTRRDN